MAQAQPWSYNKRFQDFLTEKLAVKRQTNARQTNVNKLLFVKY